MANMFSGKAEKRIPKDWKSCYESDAITQNLWVWCERIEFWGKILFWILLIVGIFDTIQAASEASEMKNLIGDATTEEMRSYVLETGFQIPNVWETMVDRLLVWLGYAALEYLAYHAGALLIGALASIEQHTKISANIALYTRAKEENVWNDEPNDVISSTKILAPKEPSAPPHNHVVFDTKTNTWRCSKCDEINPRTALYCKNCGQYR